MDSVPLLLAILQPATSHRSDLKKSRSSQTTTLTAGPHQKEKEGLSARNGCSNQNTHARNAASCFEIARSRCFRRCKTRCALHSLASRHGAASRPSCVPESFGRSVLTVQGAFLARITKYTVDAHQAQAGRAVGCRHCCKGRDVSKYLEA